MLKEIEEKWQHFQAHLHTRWEELHPLTIGTIQQALAKNLSFLRENYKNSEAKIIHSLEGIAHRLRQDDDN